MPAEHQQVDPEATWLRVSPSPADFERSTPGAQALATECLMNLVHTRDLLWGRVDRLVRRHGIPSPAGFLILTIVDGAGGSLHPRQIADRMFLTAGTITGLIATLERRGYVATRKAPGPGRRVLVSITDQGRRVQQRAVRELDLANVRWFACFTDEQKVVLLRLLGELEQSLKRDASHRPR